ncbi:MAG: ABC transporter permease [Desulfobacterales bacterium]
MEITYLELSERPSLARRIKKIFFRNSFISVGTLIMLVVLITALAGPTLCRYDPIKSSIRQRLLPPGPQHLLGTDGFGRDVLTRIVYAARISLKIALIIVVVTTFLASIIGVCVSWYKWLDNPVMRIMDVLMSIPSLILAIALMGFLGAKLTNLVIAIVLTQLPRMTRVVRSAVISIRENEYIEAARSLGASDFRIMFKYIFLNSLSPIVVQATFLFAHAILVESALSFIGVGTPPPTPSWGNMLAEGREYISVAWWLTVIPGLSIMTTVLGLNLLGDGLRDLLDPRLRGQ